MIIGVSLIGSGTTRQAMPTIDLNHAARYRARSSGLSFAALADGHLAGGLRCPATPVPNTERGVSMPRVRYAVVTTVVAALLLPLPAVATAKGDHSKSAGRSGQVERLRQTEKKRLQALVDANVAVAGPLIANDFELINRSARS
jgi:hypothetical protein